MEEMEEAPMMAGAVNDVAVPIAKPAPAPTEQTQSAIAPKVRSEFPEAWIWTDATSE